MAYAVRHSGQVQLASGFDVLAGFWLAFSPWVLGFASTEPTGRWNDLILGIVIALFAFVRGMIAYRAAWLSWLNALLGAWVMASPWVLGFHVSYAARWNNILLGLAVIVLACWSALSTDRDLGYEPPTDGR
jgi:hypothetical protein